jgi:chromosome segregation ATPase
MIKKLGWAAVALVGVVILLNNTKLGSFASTAWTKVRASANRQVPVEFEIDRIRNQIGQLMPDMKKNLTLIAEEMVAIDNLKKDIDDTRAKLDVKKQAILATTAELERGTAFVSLSSGRSQSREKVQDILSKELASYKRCEAELKSREQLLEAKEKALDAARQQVAEMREQKRELEVQVAQLEAEVKTVRLAQTRCKVQLDDSRLAEIKNSLNELQNRLKIEKTAAELQGEFANDVLPLEKAVRPTSADVVKDVRNYFDNEKVAADQK